MRKELPLAASQDFAAQVRKVLASFKAACNVEALNV